MKKTKTQKGITLIALIITIVVLLILAVVTINSVINEGILKQAQEAANTYNNSVGNEGDVLQQYSNFLSNQITNPGGGSSNGGIPSRKYTVGEEIKLTDKNGVKHDFYVMKDSSTKVTLLSKKCINTDTFLQSNANAVQFSSTNYWKDNFTSNPYDLKEIGIPDASHYAARAAYDYVTKFKMATGRLANSSELNVLEQFIEDTKIDAGGSDYWLGCSTSKEYVTTIGSNWMYDGVNAGTDYYEPGLSHAKYNSFGFVLPVLEVIK